MIPLVASAPSVLRIAATVAGVMLGMAFAHVIATVSNNRAHAYCSACVGASVFAAS